jgi:hypothetical protein
LNGLIRRIQVQAVDSSPFDVCTFLKRDSISTNTTQV